MKRKCPLDSKNKCESCLWQVSVTQTNSMTQEVRNFESCAVTQLVPLLEQNFRGVDQTADAVNGFRNEMVDGNARFLQMLSGKRLNHD